MRHLRLGLAAALIALAACAQTQTAPVEPASAPNPEASVAAFAHPPASAEAMMGHIQVLGSDEFEGRKPGTHGEELTLNYLEHAFEAIGLQPGVTNADGTRGWRQEVPLVSAAVIGNPVLTIAGRRDGARPYEFRSQFVAWTKRVVPEVSIVNAPLVFVGYGVVAPEQNWNDYAGVDMHGKIAVILINDPDFETGDDRGFGGRAMTLYGRWTYKFEEAARQGAIGALIIHETAGASYPWWVVLSSNTSARFDTVREDNGMSRAAMEGWVTTEVGQELFTRSGMNFATMKARAQRRGFRPVALNLTGSVTMQVQAQRSHSYNIIGVLPGTSHADEAVVYSSHWDHIGRCAAINNDDICNGALDNASGTAALIELARRYRHAGPAARSVAFVSVTAEEQGLLGSQYYADHPTIPPAKMVANINMDGINVNGRTHDFRIIGSGKSEMDDIATAVAQAQGRRVISDPEPEAGYFFRSDQFHFARVGVPVLYGRGGIDLLNGGEERGRALDLAYRTDRYHKPQDEITPQWDLSGAVEDVDLLYRVGRQLAEGSSWPQWRQGVEFHR